MRCFILLLLPFLFSAQDDQRVFTLKPSFGLNGCQIHGDSYSGFDKVGLFLGMAVNARLSERGSLELGFYFSQKGARHNQNFEKGDYSFYRVNLNYIDLPLSLRWWLNEDFFVTLGPSVAYLVSYGEENEIGDWSGVYPFNKLETGVNIGLGRRLGRGFSIEVRSSNSIAPIRNYGVLANRVYYPNPVARFFNKGLYNNILTIFATYTLGSRSRNTPVEQ